MSETKRPVRIANCSGFFGDRLAAAKEQVEGGAIDVLTGDWLAELTMLILARQRLKGGEGSGWATTFGKQMEQVLGTCLERGIKIVSNAGGLDPKGCADAIRAKADEAGLGHVKIAYITGDDLMPNLSELRGDGEPLLNLDTGEDLAAIGFDPLTANAYIGARGITAALAAGADVVITGRVTDAALAIGPAAWWHGWDYDAALSGDTDQLDALAGALVAGHVIECGTQATGGNYSFFQDVPGLEHPGFPIAEVAADGSTVITKHEGTGGEVSVGTVTAQLLYEIGAPAYLNPDVTARFDSIKIHDLGSDRVQIDRVRGEVPPSRLKVAINTLGGFRNTATLVLTGLNVQAKADLALRTVAGVSLQDALEYYPEPTTLAKMSTLNVSELDVQLLRTGQRNPTMLAEAQSFLRITVKDADPKKVGRPFTSAIIESALATYPGMFPTAPPAQGTPFGVYWPTTVEASRVSTTVHVDGVEPFEVSPGGFSGERPSLNVNQPPAATYREVPEASAALVPLGALVGARSGDKGGAANVGFWVPDFNDGLADLRYSWFEAWLTADRVRDLLPEADPLGVDLYRLPNLRAINVVIHGLLGRGVAETNRLDPQAKGLGEQFRARLIRLPSDLIPEIALPLSEDVV